jgi:hypothetical protein
MLWLCTKVGGVGGECGGAEAEDLEGRERQGMGAGPGYEQIFLGFYC